MTRHVDACQGNYLCRGVTWLKHLLPNPEPLCQAKRARARARTRSCSPTATLTHTYALSLSLYLALPRALASNAAELCTRALLCLACRDSTARAYRAISCAARYARIIAFCFVLVILNRKPCAGALCMCACAIGQLRAALEATPGTFDLWSEQRPTETATATLTADTKFACASNGYAAAEEEQRQRQR